MIPTVICWAFLSSENKRPGCAGLSPRDFYPGSRYNPRMVTAAASSTINLFDLTQAELTRLLDGWGYSAYHAERLWAYLYRQQLVSLDEMDDLRPDLRTKLQAHTTLLVLPTRAAAASSDGFTRKFLLSLPDGEAIETVLMKFKGRTTACISTQVGCAMGCVFCATGQMGFSRHLSPGEIVAQVMHISRILQSHRRTLRNVVLMGMGEPLHNYEATMTAIDILMDHKGLALAPKHITLSTVGVVPGIIRLADEARPVRLAVSLHAATNAERQALLPPARRWPLKELLDACRYYIEKRKRRIFFEWTLIEETNDTPEQAHALGRLLQGLDAHVNLIPLNPTKGYDGLPTGETSAKRFQSILTQYGLPSTVRQRRGIDIAAGCGQLRARNLPA
jgi:23S rRNA (adenine2503-C2)-methyltransferase